MQSVATGQAMGRSALTENLRLAWDLARRDLQARHRRAIAGSFWLVLTPLCLLGIYWLVFGRIFGVTWKEALPHGGGDVGFVLPFFIGLSVYLTLSDVVNSSSGLYASKRTFVVKSPFPIWVLWVANLMRAGVHGAILAALVLIVALLQGRLTMAGLAWTVPSLAVTLLFMSSLSLLLSSLGPFVGDISEAMRLLLRVLFYATPVTYPLSLVPEAYRGWMWFNPLTCMVEFLRDPIVFGHLPPAGALAAFAAATFLLAIASAWVFHRVKGVISDVV